MAANTVLKPAPFGRRAHAILRGLALGVALVSLYVFHLDRSESELVMPGPIPSASAPLAGPVRNIERIPTLFEPPMEMIDEAIDGAAIADPSRPQLIGIAGRLPDDAEVLLRLPDGGSTAIGIGESVQGYVLKSVAADRAVFVKDGREVLLTMPQP